MFSGVEVKPTFRGGNRFDRIGVLQDGAFGVQGDIVRTSGRRGKNPRNDASPRSSTAPRKTPLTRHEYSAELLSVRASNPPTGNEWHKFPPSFFFETASHNLISQHQRTLTLQRTVIDGAVAAAARTEYQPPFSEFATEGGIVYSG